MRYACFLKYLPLRCSSDHVRIMFAGLCIRDIACLPCPYSDNANKSSTKDRSLAQREQIARPPLFDRHASACRLLKKGQAFFLRCFTTAPEPALRHSQIIFHSTANLQPRSAPLMATPMVDVQGHLLLQGPWTVRMYESLHEKETVHLERRLSAHLDSDNEDQQPSSKPPGAGDVDKEDDLESSNDGDENTNRNQFKRITRSKAAAKSNQAVTMQGARTTGSKGGRIAGGKNRDTGKGKNTRAPSVTPAGSSGQNGPKKPSFTYASTETKSALPPDPERRRRTQTKRRNINELSDDELAESEVERNHQAPAGGMRNGGKIE